MSCVWKIQYKTSEHRLLYSEEQYTLEDANVEAMRIKLRGHTPEFIWVFNMELPTEGWRSIKRFV